MKSTHTRWAWSATACEGVLPISGRANPGMQCFLDREGDLALRLLTTKASDFEARLVALIASLVSDEASAGRLAAAVPLDDLPYVLVRIMESYIYLGLITGEHPDPDRAARVIHALLPG